MISKKTLWAVAARGGIVAPAAGTERSPSEQLNFFQSPSNGVFQACSSAQNRGPLGPRPATAKGPHCLRRSFPMMRRRVARRGSRRFEVLSAKHFGSFT